MGRTAISYKTIIGVHVSRKVCTLIFVYGVSSTRKRFAPMCCRVPRNLGRETCEKRIAFHVTRYCAARIYKMELIHLYVLKLLYLFCIILLSNKQ